MWLGGCGQWLHVHTGYPGVLDPCKGFGVDAAAGLTAQQRADLTLSAQVSKSIYMYSWYYGFDNEWSTFGPLVLYLLV